jgi:DNA-binding transcriptional MerR regulator
LLCQYEGRKKMSNNTKKKKHYDPIRYARILRTAKITGVSPRQVRRVCEDGQKNEAVLETMVRLKQIEDHVDNELIREVKKLVP